MHSFNKTVGTDVTLPGPKVNLAGERRDARANGIRRRAACQHSQPRRCRRRRRRRRCCLRV